MNRHVTNYNRGAVNRGNIQHRNYYRGNHRGYYRNGRYWPGYYGGWPYYFGYSPYSGYSPFYYSGYSPYYGSSGYSPYDYYGYGYPYADSYYAPAAPQATMDVGYVRVLLPDPDAQIWINGQAMTQSGVDRTFTTPLISAPVTYQVRAEWMSYNQVMSNERTVTISPGATTVVDFTASSGY
ncbi:MAG TPA: TIGR03000 domain-containing protein [Gemmataceae bacterium]|nr:TIGR03000 domain-containing protein [Gemmataceae bacterium]